MYFNLFLAAIFTFLVFVTGAIHDYVAYLAQWANSLDGSGPWSPTRNGEGIPVNAYGPVHVILGALIVIHPLLPKLLLALSNVLIFTMLAIAASRRGWALTYVELVIIAVMYPLFPLVLIGSCFFGLNDSLVALFIVLAFEARRRDRYEIVGTLLALGALLKFYPILFIPFLCSGRDGIFRVRGLVVCAFVFLFGIALAYAVWGGAIFSPISLGIDRGAKLLSPLAFLAALQKVLPIEPLVSWLLEFNSLMIIGVAGFFSLHGWMARLDWRITSLWGILFVFFVYKVGHQQFYMCWVAALAWVLIDSDTDETRLSARAMIPIAVFLGLFQVIYIFSPYLPGFGSYYLTGPIGKLVRHLISIPFSAAILWSLFLARAQLFRPWHHPIAIKW
jgi:hypothetical protein